MTQIDQPESLSRSRDPLGSLLLRVLGLSLTFTCHAGADVTSGTWLEVERDGETYDCPTGEELEAVTEKLLGPTAPPSRAPIRVSFSVENGRYRARFHPQGARGEARELADRTTNCEALEQALGTALALWIDTDWARERAPERPPSEPKKADADRLVAEKSKEKQAEEDEIAEQPAPREDPSRGAYLRAEVALHGGVALALTTPVAPLFSAEAALGSGRWRVGLGGTWILPSEASVGVGSASSELAYGTLRLCWEILRVAAFDLSSCGGFSAGAIRASARGYSSNESQVMPWFGVPLDVSFGHEWSHRDADTEWSALPAMQVRVGASLVIPTTRQTFSVDGVGRVIDPGPVAGLFWLEWRGGLEP